MISEGIAAGFCYVFGALKSLCCLNAIFELQEEEIEREVVKPKEIKVWYHAGDWEGEEAFLEGFVLRTLDSSLHTNV